MNKFINGLAIIVIISIGYGFSIGFTEGVLVPYDLIDPVDRPQDFSLASNNFFEAGLGSYLPTILVLATFVGLVVRKKLLETGIGSVLGSAALLFVGYIAIAFAYQDLLVPLVSRFS